MRRFSSSPLTTTLIQSTILNALANILAQVIDQYKHRPNPSQSSNRGGGGDTFNFTLNIPALIQFTIYGIIVVPINFYWQKAIEEWYPGFPRSSSEAGSGSSSRSSWFGPGSWSGSGPGSWFGFGGRKSNSRLGSRFRPRFGRGLLPFSSSSSSSKSRFGVGYGYGSGSGGAAAGVADGEGEYKEKPIPIALPPPSSPIPPPSPSPYQPSSTTSTTTTTTPTPRAKTNQSGFKNFLIKFTLDQTVGSVVNILLFIVLINLLKGISLGGTMRLILDDFGPLMLARLAYRPVVSGLMYGVVPMEKRVVFGCACGVVWGVYLSLYAAV